MSPDPTVQLESVTKTFGTKNAVDGVSLSIPAGSLCGFLGPNGAGKSTTIRMIMSIIYPDQGTVRVLGGSALAAKDRIGYLPEERGIYRKMRVGEYLLYIGRLKGLRGTDLKRRIGYWLDRIKLPDVIHKRCHELSKGMQQKVQFLAAVLNDPEVLILDEPFSGLDPVNSTLLNTIIRELSDQGRTIIFSTHVLHQAELLCDRIVLINHGRLLLDVSMDEITRRFDPRTLLVRPLADAPLELRELSGAVDTTPGDTPGSIEVHLENDADPQVIMREILKRAPVRSVELRRITLEEVFVRLVMESEGEAAAERAREELSHVEGDDRRVA